MRFFLTSFFAVTLFISCTLSTTKGLVETDVTISTFKNPYFSDTTRDYVYKANFEVYGYEFSGILIIKKLAVQHHKVVFTTEFGTKMLDMELNNDNFTIHFIADDLNRKLLINTLQKDFKILLKENVVITKAYQNDRFNIFKTSNDKRFNYYFINKETNNLEKSVNTSKTKEKVIFNFKSDDGKLARKVLIEHENMKLKIGLKAF
ncbi:hypothetical protein [Aureibaculum conchae]|uniref:hypothetical protein n=1 Tax=Aureibaculum sp. 2308TA14-22 TaxID=3108392 RepID=UPI00339B2A28